MSPVAAGGMRPIELAYGKTGLLIEITADRTTVVAPVHHPAVPDEAATLRRLTNSESYEPNRCQHETAER